MADAEAIALSGSDALALALAVLSAGWPPRAAGWRRRPPRPTTTWRSAQADPQPARDDLGDDPSARRSSPGTKRSEVRRSDRTARSGTALRASSEPSGSRSISRPAGALDGDGRRLPRRALAAAAASAASGPTPTGKASLSLRRLEERPLRDPRGRAPRLAARAASRSTSSCRRPAVAPPGPAAAGRRRHRARSTASRTSTRPTRCTMRAGVSYLINLANRTERRLRQRRRCSRPAPAPSKKARRCCTSAAAATACSRPARARAGATAFELTPRASAQRRPALPPAGRARRARPRRRPGLALGELRARARATSTAAACTCCACTASTFTSHSNLTLKLTRRASARLQPRSCANSNGNVIECAVRRQRLADAASTSCSRAATTPSSRCATPRAGDFTLDARVAHDHLDQRSRSAPRRPRPAAPSAIDVEGLAAGVGAR